MAKEKKKAKKFYLSMTTGGVNMGICTARGGGGEEQPLQVVKVITLKLRLTPRYLD